jgi:hypothetical protein
MLQYDITQLPNWLGETKLLIWGNYNSEQGFF